jgi:hypothetical protein
MHEGAEEPGARDGHGHVRACRLIVVLLASGLVMLDDMRVEPVRHLHERDGPHHPVHLVGRQGLRLHDEDRQEADPDKETLRQGWMVTDHPMAARAGWSVTAARVAKSPEGLDLPALLDRIESEMGTAAPQAQWTMNFVLAEIGIHFPDHRERALAIGEALGVYRDYPVSKGCTSPFAPIWINAMVKRQG